MHATKASQKGDTIRWRSRWHIASENRARLAFKGLRASPTSLPKRSCLTVHRSIGNFREAPRLNSRRIVRGSSAVFQSLEVSGA